ncbi:temperature induced lipocalin-like protein [Carex littledalei]|uniref:Temperature induced lipocalin-like protein n=1 Tax=Carex littledalei TaxID=544730 RepID=A0A833REW6_9POAL|nr:temperature induced lipocalin-like protein [Carex littledalei]
MKLGAKGGEITLKLGTAYKADPSSDEATFKVKFYLPPFLLVISVIRDYWMLYVDDDYQYVLVGEPQIMLANSKNIQPNSYSIHFYCIKNQMEDEVYNHFLEKAKEDGYDVSKLRKTPQDDPPPESKESGGLNLSLANEILVQGLKHLGPR